MLKKTKGILLFTKVHKDNDLFIKFLSEYDEIITGIVYGGMSSKKRNIFQIGYFFNFNITSKFNRPSSISAELSDPYISSIINNKYKLYCLLSSVSIINLSIIEGQKIENIFNISQNFLKILIIKKNWITEHFQFLFNLLKIIGYEIDYKINSKKKYLNLETLEFTANSNKNTLIFPFHILENNNNIIDYKSVYDLFFIFENVIIKNHLFSTNLQLPNHYQLFKKLIIEYLKK